MTKKMTKREAFLLALVALQDDNSEEGSEASDVIAHEVEMLAKKSKTSTPDPKKVAEQNALMDAIATTLANSDEPMRATAIAIAIGVSVQRVTALLKKMVTSGEVVREQDKKVVTFTLS